MTKLWVVATSQKEADEIAYECGHDSAHAAGEHLKEVKAPPTDPFYANQYRVYIVRRP